MSDDIVTRLRERAIVLFCNGADGNAFIDEQAADEIERLRADRDKWRKVADLCVMAIGIPENDVDRIAVREYDEAVRGDE